MNNNVQQHQQQTNQLHQQNDSQKNDARQQQSGNIQNLDSQRFDNNTQNLNNLLASTANIPGLDSQSNQQLLQGLPTQLNGVGLGNFDLSNLGSLTADQLQLNAQSLTEKMDPQQSNMLNADILKGIPGLDALTSGQKTDASQALANLAGIGTLPDNMLQNLQQNLKPSSVNDQDYLKKIQQNQDKPNQDSQNLGGAVKDNQTQLDILAQLNKLNNIQGSNGNNISSPLHLNYNHQDQSAQLNNDLNKLLQGIPGITGGVNPISNNVLGINGMVQNQPQSTNQQDALKAFQAGGLEQNQLKADPQSSLNINNFVDSLGISEQNQNIASQLQLRNQIQANEFQIQNQLQGIGQIPGQQAQFQNLGMNMPGGLTSGLQGLPSNILGQINGLSAYDNNNAMKGLGGFGLNMNMGNFGGGQPSMPQMPSMRPQGPNQVLIPGSAAHAAAFHAKGPDYEIKLFVGGLAFQTQESDLIEYFKQFGIVADAIVMRDKHTQRGRGFGFVKMQFTDQGQAQDNKDRLLKINGDHSRGHIINNKKVDVKSADDYIKPPMSAGQQPGMNPMAYGQMNQHVSRTDPNMMNARPKQEENLQNVQKPNPYVIVSTEDKDGNGNVNQDQQNQQEAGGKKEVVFKYPKSKIFVGGLDFKLTNDDLRQHFLQYGDIESAVILKDINTGQSRGFGFVTFKDEAVAQDLIQNLGQTNIFGRKVDIKSAEPKQSSMNQPAPVIPRKMNPGDMYGNQSDMKSGSQFAMIPQYGEGGKDDQAGPYRRIGHQKEDGNHDYEYESQNSNQFQRRGDPGRRMPPDGRGHYGNDDRPKGDGYKDQNDLQQNEGGPMMGDRQERPRDNYRDRQYRDDRDRGDPRDRYQRRRVPAEYEDDRRERRQDRDRRHRRGHHHDSRSDSVDSSKSSSYNHGKGRHDRRRGQQKREKRGPHHGGGHQSPQNKDGQQQDNN